MAETPCPDPLVLAAFLLRVDARELVTSRDERDLLYKNAGAVMDAATSRGFLIAQTDSFPGHILFKVTDAGRAFAANFDFSDIVHFSDTDSTSFGASFRRHLWGYLILHGDTDATWYGDSFAWGRRLDVAHLVTCGAAPGLALPTRSVWSTDSGTEYGLEGVISCQCMDKNPLTRRDPLRFSISLDNDETNALFEELAFSA
jgi:hypothetical protein